MERKFLEELGLAKHLVDKVLDEAGQDIGKQKKSAQALARRVEELENRLAQSGEEAEAKARQAAAEAEAKAAEWEQRHQADTAALTAEMERRQYEGLVKEAVDGLGFSSAAARRAFADELRAAPLPVEDGGLAGLEERVAAWKQADPDAFCPSGAAARPVFSAAAGGPAPGRLAGAIRAAFGLE